MAAVPKFAGRRAEQLKPPLKWAGGKRWLVPHLFEIWQRHNNRRLVEPLCGGLAVALGLLPRSSLLNDINPHAINFYRWLQRGLRIEIQMRNSSSVYYSHRERFNHLISVGESNSAEAAALFYYLNRTGYNGLCRFNSAGHFNVPFGRYKQINYQIDFSSYRSLLMNWDFRTGDFESMPILPDDFVYADPPYDVQFTKYSKEGFEWEDQVRLAEWLSRHSGPVVLSNQATERVQLLYKKLGFRMTALRAPRRISCTGDRTPAPEVLAVKGI